MISARCLWSDWMVWGNIYV